MIDERRALARAGKAVVANINNDRELLDWAKAVGRMVYIGRRNFHRGLSASDWANPYRMQGYSASERSKAVAQFRAYLQERPDLLQRIDDGELRGKVLACYCHPEECHGHLLAQLTNIEART